MLDFSNKEFVRSFVYSNFKHDRSVCKNVIILGREYCKIGTMCATTMVCDCWKVYDSSVKRFKYVYMAGVARQHPKDINIKYSDGVEIAHKNALDKPVMQLVFDEPIQFEAIECMMGDYISQLPIQMVKTKQELDYEEFLHNCNDHFDKHIGE